uniref:Uncharacterized protein n=1 Tax=Anopheles minimus TaxID=112268 RepID=A0A182WN12_9DIPT
MAGRAAAWNWRLSSVRHR